MQLVNPIRYIVKEIMLIYAYEYPGGQAFMVKLRKTSDRTPYSMIIDPPYSLNGSRTELSSPPRWRHMKYVL